MFTQEQTTLFHAADTLRHSIETFQCSHYTSLIEINNTYFLNIYKYFEQVSFASLEKDADDRALKMALFNSCASFYINQKKSMPFTHESKNQAFLNNLCQMLNTPFFEKEMQQKQKEPAMIFTQVLWNNYKKNWQNFTPQS